MTLQQTTKIILNFFTVLSFICHIFILNELVLIKIKTFQSEKFDARTQLETQAYVAWCEGMLQFELQEWKPAIENLKKAQ